MNVASTHRQSTDVSASFAIVLLGIFILVIGMLGGSSRSDAVQLVALRPLCAIFFGIAIYFATIEHIKQATVLVWLLGLLAVWMLLQILPLPPAIWHSLADREHIVELDRLAGVEGIWRPISLVPTKGLNALLSLIVPATAMLIALAMKATSRQLLQLLAALGVFDAIWGILQVVSGTSSPLYTYAITNRGLPVGMFANENHSATFSAIVLIIIARLGASSVELKEPAWLRLVYVLAFVIALLSVLVSGSRAGLLMAALALISSAIVAWLSMTSNRTKTRQTKARQWVLDHPKVLLVTLAAAILVLFGAFAALERVPALQGFYTQNAFDDLRWRLWPTLEQMIGTHWLVGVGFGAFAEFYQIYEPTELMSPKYVNQAHNDWAQLVIEGGIPMVLLVLALLRWIWVSLKGMFIEGREGAALAFFWLAIVAVICGSSVIDYPLRTPALQAIAVWLMLALALEANAYSSGAETASKRR